jgi:enterochelin esterase-like enzyme
MPNWSFRRRLALLAGVALLAEASFAAHAATGAAPSRGLNRTVNAHVSAAAGQVLHLTIPSPTLGATRPVAIYLPPGYADAANSGRRYPVLYLLSGAPGSAGDWFTHMHAAQTADRLIASGAVPPLLLVSPDGNGSPHRDSQFLDSFDGRQRVETFLVRDVLGYIDAHYRTITARAARGLAGYSAGAYGALNVGLHHPELFGTLAGFSGYYTADPTEVAHPELNHPMSADPAFLRHISPSVSIVGLRPNQRPAITLVESTIDGHYTDTTRQFDAQLTRLAVPHTTHIYAPRTVTERQSWRHSWSFVTYAFSDSLPAIVAIFHQR